MEAFAGRKMKTLARIVTVSLAATAAAQAAPAISLDKVNRYADGSSGAILVDAKGRTPFHIGLTGYRCDLFVGGRHEDHEGARRLPAGSHEEAELVARLVAWTKIAFDDKERASIEAAADVHHRGSGWTFDRYKEAAVVNRLAHYRLIRGAEITNVFEGRSTVHLSFKVRDGLGKQQLVMFRRLEAGKTGGTARPHLGDSVSPVVEDSLEERWILQAMLSYTQQHVNAKCRDAWWAGNEVQAKDVAPAARSVLSTLVEYKRATSPRIVNVFRMRDGGSTVYALVDARGKSFDVRFDKQIDSKNTGRMMYRAAGGDETLVAFGSPREKELLAGFDVCLARGGKHARDALRKLLAVYRDLAAEEADK